LIKHAFFAYLPQRAAMARACQSTDRDRQPAGVPSTPLGRADGVIE